MLNVDAKSKESIRFAANSTPPRARAGPGVQVAAYAFGSTAVRDFLMPLGVTAYKYGLTGRRYVDQRVSDLRRMHYASIIAPTSDPQRPIRISPNGHEWFLSPLAEGEDVVGQLAKLPHARFDKGVISFRIPPTVNVAALEKEFQCPETSMPSFRALTAASGLASAGSRMMPVFIQIMI